MAENGSILLMLGPASGTFMTTIVEGIGVVAVFRIRMDPGFFADPDPDFINPDQDFKNPDSVFCLNKLL